MKTHELVQGSQEWHAHRAAHFNASDSPAMMGVSKYKTRDQLLQELSTGITHDVDAATQRRFDDGHRCEALARTLAEEIIGQELYPVTGSEGKYSASFDGLTMLEDIAFEHKTLNDEIRATESIDDLHLMYRIQMEQQLMVSGAESCLFLASKWDNQGELIESKELWYLSDSKLRQDIVAGWEQFEKDLATYTPREIKEAPKAEAIMQLPALAIQIKGEVTLSNLPQFKAAADQFIANIKTDLQTDEDFANAEETVKFCDKAEKELELTKKAAIAQTASIDELMRTIDHIKAQLRDKRLMLDKAVKEQKETIKLKIIRDANELFLNHLDALYAETKPIELNVQRPDFAGAIKGLKKLDSIHDAVNTALANAKIGADAVAKDVRSKLAWFKESALSHNFLFHDLSLIIAKPMDDFQLVVTTRIADHKKAEDARIKAEAEKLAAQQEAAKPADQPAPPAETVAQPAPANVTEIRQEAVIEHQDVIAAFLKFRQFKDETKVRAILVEFIKFQAEFGMRKST